jgi:hypothetical protein
MHPINRHHFVPKAFAMIALMLSLAQCATGEGTTFDRDIWRRYTPDQKKLALAGFTDCYRSVLPNKGAFARSDVFAAIRLIDEASHKDENLSFGSLILQSVKQAPSVKPDTHAEHWEGPTGFHSGLWWRGIENPDREAYVQGAFWCVQVINAAEIVNSHEPILQAVERLNNWYVISDDDWKDPRSNARVDVSVISALERVGVLRIKKTKAATK